jgi:putative Holliday junction resolvase
MARILALDYGKKRTGIAVTDPLQMIASPLETIDTQSLFDFLKDYISKEAVEKILIGLPLNLDGSDTDVTAAVRHNIRRLKNSFPEITIETVDEEYSSKEAAKAMVEMGMKKKDRQEKGNLDKMAAALMLRKYLDVRP